MGITTLIFIAIIALGLCAALACGLFSTQVSRLTESVFDSIEYALALRRQNRAVYAPAQLDARRNVASLHTSTARHAKSLTASGTLRLQRDRFAA